MYRGEEKGFRCQFRAKRDGIQSPKDAARSGKNPVCGRRGKGCRKSIQRLLRGGSMPFRGLRKPPALPEGLTLLFGQCGARRTARCSFRHIAERRPPRTGGGRLSAAGVRRAPAGAAVQRRKTGRAGRGGFGWLLSRACGRFCAGQAVRRLCRHASRTSGYRLHTARMGLSKSSLSTVTPMVTPGACPCGWLFVTLTHVSSTGSRWSGWEKPYWMTE